MVRPPANALVQLKNKRQKRAKNAQLQLKFQKNGPAECDRVDDNGITMARNDNRQYHIGVQQCSDCLSLYASYFILTLNRVQPQWLDF